LADRLTTARKVLGLSLQKQNWEAGQHEPTAKNVELVERFLKTLGNPPVLELTDDPAPYFAKVAARRPMTGRSNRKTNFS